jgi:alanyl-tRNA synthetase
MARRDYSALSEAASLFSAQLWDVPEQIRKSLDENKGLRKQREDALDQLADFMVAADLQDLPEKNGRKILVKVFNDRDINFAKLFAQKATRTGMPVVALVASTVNPPGMVFAQSSVATPGGSGDMGALLKQVLSSVGGRGGGSRDFAQGGVPAGSSVSVEQLLRQAADTIGS